MQANHKYKSGAFAAIHAAVKGMERAGTIDKATMRRFDAACLTTPPYFAPQQIKQIRESNMSASPCSRAT